MAKGSFPAGGSCFVVNAKILTMEADAPAADSMWVQDGKISWIGRAAQAPAAAEREQLIDCAGRVVLPGFIDPHMHLAPLAMLHSFENVGPFRFASADQAITHLGSVAAETPPGDWVVGRQFDPSLQEGPDYLTRHMLDEASTEHPIFVYNASLHIAYCNSLALSIAGVDAATPDPHGAEIGRDDDGTPNGVLKAGPAMALVARHNPYAKQQNLGDACLNVFEHASSLGITMLCDQGTGLFQGVKELDLYQGMRDSGRMTVRFRYSLSQALAQRWDEKGAQWGEGDEWLRVTGWKVVADGSNQGRTGLQRQPFLNSDSTGIAYVDVDELNEAVETRLRDGWAVCVHANGDAAIDRALDAFARAADLGLDPGGRRCRIEHCSILHDEQIELMATLGVSPSFLIGHVYYWGAAFIDDVFGLEKASLLDRTGACEAKGIRWTIHSDDPVTEMNPLRCIENAVTRSMWRSADLLAPQECISVEAALRSMTIDAAWQCHSDHEVGSLVEGKFADFVILSEDPTEIDPHNLSQIGIEETWVNGRQVYSGSAKAKQ
jgi:predicted amidohydrolase YtcJ